MSTITDDTRWQAVLERDAAYDGQFFFAVRTTGVYCRPSCSARTPQRANVAFYATTTEAEGAGYRPCKRCTPDRLSFEAEMVQQLCDYMDQNFDTPITLRTLSEQVHLSPDHVQRVFKRLTGVTPHQYVEARRVGQLKANLKAGQEVAMALYDAGFSSPSRVYEDASRKLGMTPTIYRRGGEGLQIRYGIAEVRLGYLLLAATERGVCALSLGDTRESVETWLHRDYPLATCTEDSQELAEMLTTLSRHLEGSLRQLELPLDVQATTFQLRVWEELRKIPYGETRSYTDVAESLGMPKAVRAVAQACANNRVALVIPCHRVVRSDGDLSGYRWGIERKASLLAAERQYAAS